MLNVQDTDVYTDFNGFSKLRKEAKDKTPESIKKVAKQFESIFVGMMIKGMRQGKLAEGILDSKQSEFYRDMYDQQLSTHLAGQGGIGLADVIVKQLSPKEFSELDVREQKITAYERQVFNRKQTIKKVESQPIELMNQTKKITPFFDKVIQTADDFVTQLRPHAQQAAKELGVDANVLLAQAALETGWGKSVIKSKDGLSSHNLFNIKADKSWHGQQHKVATLEFKDGIAKKEMAGFRSYASYKESFNDYVTFIKTNPRYDKALKVAENPKQYMQALQKAGYATDPHYAEKVMKLYQSNTITQQNPDMLAAKQAISIDKL